MKWLIPAKTFLLGEYVALIGGPSLLVTTYPCFELSLSYKPGLEGIHPQSPAGRFWLQHRHDSYGLVWNDPYHGRGGMGASSAQFLGAYLAHMAILHQKPQHMALLKVYKETVSTGRINPSGYDVLAQSLHRCVYIHQHYCQSLIWPFPNISFILVHTGKKLATHEHLQKLELEPVSSASLAELATLVESAKSAFISCDEHAFISAIHTYHKILVSLELVAPHSQSQLETLLKHPHILAAKGCGAMGADVLLVLVPKEKLEEVSTYCLTQNLDVLATSETNLHQNKALIENKSAEILEIS